MSHFPIPAAYPDYPKTRSATSRAFHYTVVLTSPKSPGMGLHTHQKYVLSVPEVAVLISQSH